MTRRGRRIHFCFILAGVLACYELSWMSFVDHLLLLWAIATLVLFGILGAIVAAITDIWGGAHRRQYWYREEER